MNAIPVVNPELTKAITAGVAAIVAAIDLNTEQLKRIADVINPELQPATHLEIIPGTPERK